MPLNRGTPPQPKWCGYVKYRGRKKWVGTHDSLEAFKSAKERCRAELREEVDNPHGRRGVPTVGEFAGATIHDDGQLTMTWPDGERAQKATEGAPRPCAICATGCGRSSASFTIDRSTASSETKW